LYAELRAYYSIDWFYYYYFWCTMFFWSLRFRGCPYRDGLFFISEITFVALRYGSGTYYHNSTNIFLHASYSLVQMVKGWAKIRSPLLQ
jgi:hypothetical protein